MNLSAKADSRLVIVCFINSITDAILAGLLPFLEGPTNAGLGRVCSCALLLSHPACMVDYLIEEKSIFVESVTAGTRS